MVNHNQHHQQNEARRKISLFGCFFFIIHHVNPQPHQPHLTGKPLPSSMATPPSSWVIASPAAALSSPPSSIAAPPSQPHHDWSWITASTSSSSSSSVAATHSQPTASSWFIVNYQKTSLFAFLVFISRHVMVISIIRLLSINTNIQGSSLFASSSCCSHILSITGFLFMLQP